MTKRFSLTILVFSIMLTAVAGLQAGTIRIQADKPGHEVSKTLWGIFFEDINLSVDGGIYPELVRNRSFEDSEKPEYWKLVNVGDGKSEMSIDDRTPLNPFNRKSLRVRLDGRTSLTNEGYWGMAMVQGNAYHLRLAVRSGDGFRGPLHVLIEDSKGGDIAKGEINGLTDRWKWFELDLTAGATEPKAKLILAAEGKGTLWLDMVSLMPKKTWKDHGLRPDICEMLDGLKPAFVRFPGGCWVEGDDMAHMYHWKDTIGDPAVRTPLWNIWGYWATHGVGYQEYLQLSEDLGAEPLFCINVGMSHKEVIPMDRMGQWVQDALDAIEYANGPVDSVWGSLRAINGHPAPFNLKYLEIGNENGGPAYHERWELFYKAVKAKYPEVILIANVWGGYPTKSMPEIIDEHYYNNPEFFMLNAGKYDSYDRKGPKVFVGEYAVTQGTGQGNLRGAIGEAAFMTGMERNSDIVVMASYAPLLVNVNHRKWNPDLINYDSSRIYGLPSYYVQQLFSVHRGDVVLPTQVDAPMTSVSLEGGCIGVGTWLTRAEYKDIKVVQDGKTLFESDFSKNADGWKMLGDGRWQVKDGALQQGAMTENVRAIIGDKSWKDYTLTLKARKISGDEGFLILFNVQNEEAKSWWNIGGWGNTRHAVEMGGVSDDGVRGRVETGKWYDIRVEVKGDKVKCFLDDKLIHDMTTPSMKALYASATLDKAAGQVILKVVNADSKLQDTEIDLGTVSVGKTAERIVLTSEKSTDENSLAEPKKVAPVTDSVEVAGAKFQTTFAPNSLTVLRIPLK
ncbi:MAG: DUF1080 domain-containing protein [Phycisphaerae bacterium]|nr:DUF1080 domain-containing protein [Phycisphaerae bacterium]